MSTPLKGDIYGYAHSGRPEVRVVDVLRLEGTTQVAYIPLRADGKDNTILGMRLRSLDDFRDTFQKVHKTLPPGLYVADDENDRIQVFIVRDEDVDFGHLWRINEEPTHATQKYWEEQGYTSFREVQTYGGLKFL